jgi:hypothetical protein
VELKKGGNPLISEADLQRQTVPPLTYYRPFKNVPKANNANPTTTNQKAKPESTGMVTKKATIPSTPMITEIHHVITLGALSFMIFFSFPGLNNSLLAP